MQQEVEGGSSGGEANKRIPEQAQSAAHFPVHKVRSSENAGLGESNERLVSRGKLKHLAQKLGPGEPPLPTGRSQIHLCPVLTLATVTASQIASGGGGVYVFLRIAASQDHPLGTSPIKEGWILVVAPEILIGHFRK